MPDDFFAGETVALEAEVIDSKDRPRTPQPSVGLTVEVLDEEEETVVLAEAAMTRVGVDGGNATGGSPTTLIDTDRAWEDDEWAGAIVRITAGTGLNQERRIRSNTATTLTIDTEEVNEFTGLPHGQWPATPDATSVYQIHRSTYRYLWSIPSAQAGKTLIVVYRSEDAIVGVNAEKLRILVDAKAV